ncbi:hypothetical protein [Oceanobacillus kimchii]|uniref:hypothetical protein n=1 Tax=Oceanobacillus kimchii TaxID=746691 RepID=UPI003B011375
MALIDKFTKDELLEYKILKDKMLNADTTNKIRYYEKKIHDIFDSVEYRIKIEKAIDIGRTEIIMSLLHNGMSIEEVVKHTPFSVRFIEELKRDLQEEV